MIRVAGASVTGRRLVTNRTISVQFVAVGDQTATPRHAGHGASARESSSRSSASSSASVTSSSTMVCADSTKPCVASRSARAIAVGLPARIAPDAWPARICSLGDREDRVLGAAAAREQVGQQQLGVELDDAQEQLVVAQRADGADDPVDEAVRPGRGRTPRRRPRPRRRRPTRGSSGRPAAAACPTRRGRSSSARRRPGGRSRSASYAASRRRGCTRGRCRDRRHAARAAEPSL